MIGIEFVKDRQTKERAVAERDAVVQACFYKGLLVLGAGKNAIRLSPSLVITKAQADKALGILDQAIGEVTARRLIAATTEVQPVVTPDRPASSPAGRIAPSRHRAFAIVTVARRLHLRASSWTPPRTSPLDPSANPSRARPSSGGVRNRCHPLPHPRWRN